MSDKQPGAPRRGGTGEDASARDWVGGEAPEHDPSLPPPAAEPAEGEGAAAGPTAGAGAGEAADPAEAAADATSGAGNGRPGAGGAGTSATVLPGGQRARSGRGRSSGGRSSGGRSSGGRSSGAGATSTSSGATSAATPAAAPAAAASTSTDTPPPAPPRQVVRATGPPRRPPMLVQGLWPAALGGALVAASAFGLLPLTVAVLGVQVFLILGALALLDAPASGGIFLVATAATLVGDAVVLADDGEVGRLAGAAGLAVVAALLHQLLRKGRSRVTESLADTFVVTVVALAAACLLALRQVEGGDDVLLVGFATAGAVLLAGRVGDRLAPRPMLAVGSTRGWPGLLLGLGAGVAVAVLAANADAGDLPLRSAALIGLVVASTVATADLAVDLGAAELRAGWRDARRVAALRPTALLLPYAVLGPIALLAGRLVLA